MLRTFINAAISVLVIVGATWLSKRVPAAAGFVTALPITTMLVLVLGHADEVPVAQQAIFARSLLIAIPLSASFLLPFALADKMKLAFWPAFAVGVAFLAVGYAVHRAIVGE